MDTVIVSLGRQLRAHFGLGSTLLLAFLGGGCQDTSSSSPEAPAEVTDTQLYELQQAPTVWQTYRMRNDTLMRAGNSAHPERIFVRYNPVAASQLDDQGRIRPEADFADSSLIVKDVFAGSARTVIAYMFKMRSAPNAGPEGWVWAETLDDGTPFISASTRGAGCAPCHSIGIDYTRMNDAHP
jgi:hypothetical protein